MKLDTLPAEVLMMIMGNLTVIDLISVARTNFALRNFILKQSEKLPKLLCTCFKVEEFGYKRFRYIISTVLFRDKKVNENKVTRTLTMALKAAVDLVDELAHACEEVTEFSIRPMDNEYAGRPITVEFLTQLCSRLPNLVNLSVEDFSHNWSENANPLIRALKQPVFVEFRSSVQGSRLRLDDSTLEHFIKLGRAVDVIVLSTYESSFSKDKNVDLSRHMYIELHHVQCTTSEFCNMLQNNMNAQFESEPTRGTYNSFHLNIRGYPVFVNIKHFDDSPTFCS